MEKELTSIDFSCQVAEEPRSPWLQILGNQLIDRSPYIRHTNHKYCSLHNITWICRWVNTCVVWLLTSHEHTTNALLGNWLLYLTTPWLLQNLIFRIFPQTAKWWSLPFIWCDILENAVNRLCQEYYIPGLINIYSAWWSSLLHYRLENHGCRNVSVAV